MALGYFRVPVGRGYCVSGVPCGQSDLCVVAIKEGGGEMTWPVATTLIAIVIGFVFFVGFIEGRITINIGGKK